LAQKIHPIGFRLVTIQKSKSLWYTNFENYSTIICEDTIIRRIVETYNIIIRTINKKDKITNIIIKVGIGKIFIERNINYNKIRVFIYTARPGILVGKLGNELNLIILNFKKYFITKIIILNIIEINEPNYLAILLGALIVEFLEKRIPFRKIISDIIQKAKNTNVCGIKVQISGRLNGIDMARNEWVRNGSLPLQTLRANIDYAEKRANTVYGVLGIKIWLFKDIIF
jgi:small subunit ribosomal protein S3